MRLIGAKEYGQYSLLLSQYNLIVALGYGWLNQAQLRYFSKDSLNNNYKDFQSLALLLSNIFCLILLSALIFYQELSLEIWIISIFAIISIGGFNYIKIFYQANILPKKILFITVAQSLMALLIPLLVMIFLGNNSKSLLIGVATSFLFCIIIFTKNIKINFSFIFNKKRKINDIEIIKKWFRYGSPLSIWFAAGLALSFLDRYFINHYLTKIELGTYSSLQEILVRSFSFTLFPLTMALHPRIMNLWNKSKFQEATQLTLKSIFFILSLGLLILLIIWNYSDVIFLFLQTLIPQFGIESKNLVFPLLSAGFLWQLSFLTHKMLELKEQTILMAIAIVPSLIINIVGNNYFLPIMGGIATAYTALFSALIYCMITGIHFIYSIKKIRA